MANLILEQEGSLVRVTQVAAFSFIVSVLVFIASILFFPLPDLSKEPPVISHWFMTLGQIATSLLIMGCIAFATVQVEEKKRMSSIGFNLMAIAQGIIFVLYTISYSGDEKVAEAYRIFSASLYLLLASIVLIAVFSDFPKWIKIAGVISCLPYVIENAMFSINEKVTKDLLYLSTAGSYIFNFTVLCWGVFILLKLKNDLLELNKTGE